MKEDGIIWFNTYLRKKYAFGVCLDNHNVTALYLFILYSVSFIAFVVLCAVICLSVVCYVFCVMCVICVLCHIVVSLPLGKNPFAI
jgi:hypothetical protein